MQTNSPVCGDPAWRSSRMPPTQSFRWKAGLTSPITQRMRFASLRWHGYRPAHRYIVFQLLPQTLKLGPDVWRVLSKCHDIRNLGEYEGDLNVDERIFTDLLAACRSVAKKLDTLAPIKN